MYGLRIVNPTNELVITTDSYTLGYLGKATFMSTTQAASGSGGFSSFTIDSPGAPVPVIEMVDGSCGNVESVTSAGGLAWTIDVSHGDPTVKNSTGFMTQTAPVVHVWGFPSGPAQSEYGLMLYRDDGTVCADLSKRPFKVFKRINFGAGNGLCDGLVGIPARIGIVGRLADYYLAYNKHGALTDIRSSNSAFMKYPPSPTTNIQRVPDLREFSPNEDVSGTPAANTLLQKLTGFLGRQTPLLVAVHRILEAPHMRLP